MPRYNILLESQDGKKLIVQLRTPSLRDLMTSKTEIDQPEKDRHYAHCGLVRSLGSYIAPPNTRLHPRYQCICTASHNVYHCKTAITARAAIPFSHRRQ
jgi:hypothetical protein